MKKEMITYVNEKKIYTAGVFALDDNDAYTYYTYDFIKFYNEDKTEMTEDDLRRYAICLNSPWSVTNEKYSISCNIMPSKKKEDKENEPELYWTCEYSIIGYDGLLATIMGYGGTDTEAFQKCKEHFEYLQKRYNPENESF